ncbi:MAG TPA: hypothetical protein VJJ82_04120 [Candidatus Nanoarchaeia archaeon]|nr:hypothetical protein [Candidatus Nanoarchaeia archaeon]
MTTIVGVQTGKGPIDAVVLGADTTICYFSGDQLNSTGQNSKFIYSSGAPWIIAHTGMEGDAYAAFLKRINGSQKAVQRTTNAIDRLIRCYRKKSPKQFTPFASLLKDEDDEMPEENASVLLLAASGPNEPSLWKLQGDANIREVSSRDPVPYVAVGAGYLYGHAVFSQLGRRLDLNEAVQHVIYTLKTAQEERIGGRCTKQTYSWGYQIAIVTATGVHTTAPFNKNQLSEFCACCKVLLFRISSELPARATGKCSKTHSCGLLSPALF